MYLLLFLVVLRIYVVLAILQPYRDMEAGDFIYRNYFIYSFEIYCNHSKVISHRIKLIIQFEGTSLIHVYILTDKTANILAV